jgi:hypothetical protein
MIIVSVFATVWLEFDINFSFLAFFIYKTEFQSDNPWVTIKSFFWMDKIFVHLELCFDAFIGFGLSDALDNLIIISLHKDVRNFL